MVVDDLAQARLLWIDEVQKLIPHRHLETHFGSALHDHPANEIKSVIKWNPQEADYG